MLQWFVVRYRLNSVPNEAMKYGAFVRKEELRRFPHRHIEFVKSPEGHVLQSYREMLEAFRPNFRHCFAHCPDLMVGGLSQLFS